MDAALSALENVLRQPVEAFFALMFASDISPVAMRAVVALSQLIHCFLDQLDANWIVSSKSWLLTLNDLVRPGDQTIFVPLRAETCFPSLSTDVAELCAAAASTQVSNEPGTTKSRKRVRTSYDYNLFRAQPFSHKNNSVASHARLPNG